MIKKISKIIILSLIGLIITSILSFYLLICVGLSPKLQTIWVETAMTTYTHKWLATSFISEEKINEIMAKNQVNDEGYETDTSRIITTEKEAEKAVFEAKNISLKDAVEKQRKIREQKYIDMNYEKLEKGIWLKEVSDTGWRGYIMLIEDPKRVKLADTPKQFSCGTTVKKMIELNNAVAGINGGGFQDGPNYDSNGGMPAGIIIKNGKLITTNLSENSTHNIIGFNSDGILILKKDTVKWAMKNDIQEAISFSPYLIVNGEGLVKGTGGWGIAPRTAIGQLQTGEVLFLVIDGRQPLWSVGVDLKVLQDTLLAEGCYNAAMLDGGSSTVMVYNNEFVNKPSLGHERYINNAWIVTK